MNRGMRLRLDAVASEVRVRRVLVAHRAIDITEAAALSRLKRSTARDALHRLEEKHLARREVRGRRILYVDPTAPAQATLPVTA